MLVRTQETLFAPPAIFSFSSVAMALGVASAALAYALEGHLSEHLSAC